MQKTYQTKVITHTDNVSANTFFYKRIIQVPSLFVNRRLTSESILWEVDLEN